MSYKMSAFSTNPWDYRSGWYSFSEPKTIGSFYLEEGRKYVAGDGKYLRYLRVPPVKNNPADRVAGSGDGGNARGSVLVEPIDLDSIVVPPPESELDKDKEFEDSFSGLRWVAENFSATKAAGKDNDRRSVQIKAYIITSDFRVIKHKPNIPSNGLTLTLGTKNGSFSRKVKWRPVADINQKLTPENPLADTMSMAATVLQ
jgi:hypothetical protein